MRRPSQPAEFLGYGPYEATPDYSTLSLTRRWLPPAVFDEVLQFVLKIVDEKRLRGSNTAGVDGATPAVNVVVNRRVTAA